MTNQELKQMLIEYERQEKALDTSMIQSEEIKNNQVKPKERILNFLFISPNRTMTWIDSNQVVIAKAIDAVSLSITRSDIIE